MRTIIAVGLALILYGVGLPAWTQSGQMKVTMKDGSATFIPLSGIQKITFGQLTSISGRNVPGNVLQSLLLLQNYPNPFNPSTTIKYELPKAGEVQVQIFNLNGQVVASLDVGIREAGAHELRWDGKNQRGVPAASGVYLCQVRFEKFVVSRKMMLLK